MADRGLPNLERGSVITVGTFDGVHRGHREVLSTLRDRAAKRGLPALAVTFSPHPLAVVNPAAAPKLLTPDDERLVQMTTDVAPDYAIVIPFSTSLAALSAEQFVQLLVRRYVVAELVIGYDHGLGRGRQGDAAALRAIGASLGFSVTVVDALLDARGTAISSTEIRRAIAYGDLAAAAGLLGRPYAMEGEVVRGSGRGRGIGIPTINLAIPAAKLLPPDGVYAVRVSSARGAFGGMMNLGGRPTFGETARVPEIHLFEASGDWYGARTRVEFVTRLRDTVRFAGVDELVAQLGRDAEHARSALKTR